MTSNITISSMIIGEKARIKGFMDTGGSYREKLLSMGLVKETEFTLTKKAPLGDPIEIEIMGYKLSLRKKEAEIIEIEKINMEESK